MLKDRGDSQIEVLLTLLYCHLLYPSRVYLNRGNHEDLSINLSRHFDPNYKKDTDRKYGKYGSAVFNESQRLFRRLPVATIIENNVNYRVFITHGGISDRISLSYINSSAFNRFQFASVAVKNNYSGDLKRTAEIFSDLIWSDPSRSNGCTFNNHRGAGYLFGPDVSENFCKKYGFNHLIRSHEVRDDGASEDHSYCSTVFSSSLYCGGSNKAAVIIIDPFQAGFTTHKFTTSHLYKDGHERQRRALISGLKSYLDKESSEILRLFDQHDSSRSGWVDLNTWARILSNYIQSKEGLNIEPIHFLSLKDYICPCDEDRNLAQYIRMFDVVIEQQSSGKQIEFLKTIFSMFDLDNNRTLSIDEAHNAIRYMNSKLNTNYSVDLIISMDTNRDGVVDWQEFINSFVKAYKL
jgi:diadenosine tetraphosphatase ApaH/serine/threonine PP2A family protein phosphatase